MNRAALLALCLLAACVQEETVAGKPTPVALSEESLGYYCQMHLLEHEGPKGQIHLAGLPAPIFFAQVRDGVAYIKAGEREADVLAFFVNDMGAAATWSDPGADNWISAADAFFVVGSTARGGMGAPELVPFSVEADARAFAAERGGTVARLSDVPAEAVLSPVPLDAMAGGTADNGG